MCRGGRFYDSPEITCSVLNRKDTSSRFVWLELILTPCWVELRPCEMQCKLRTRHNHALHLVCGWLPHQQTTNLRQDVHQWKGKQHANCLSEKFVFPSTPLLQVVLVAFHRTDCAPQTSCGVFSQQTAPADCLVSSIQTHTFADNNQAHGKYVNVCHFDFESCASEYGPCSQSLFPPYWTWAEPPLQQRRRAVGWTLPCRRWRRPAGAGLSVTQLANL